MYIARGEKKNPHNLPSEDEDWRLNLSKETFMLKVCRFLCISVGIFKVVHLFPSVFRKTNKNAHILDVTSVFEQRKKCFDGDKQKYLLWYIEKLGFASFLQLWCGFRHTPLSCATCDCRALPQFFPGRCCFCVLGFLPSSAGGMSESSQCCWLCRSDAGGPGGCWVCRKHLLSIRRSAQQLRLREFGASGM